MVGISERRDLLIGLVGRSKRDEGARHLRVVHVEGEGLAGPPE